MTRHEAEYDLVVVGGGMGGLAASSLAQRLGLTTALLEAHTKLGGCAGHFSRGPFTFDAGATALMGLESGEPVGDLLSCVGLDLGWEDSAGYRVHLPDRTLDLSGVARPFEAETAAAFPGLTRRQAAFWGLQKFVGEALLRAGESVPRFPLRSPGDVLYNLGALGPAGLLSAGFGLLTTRNVLGLTGLAGDQAFRSLVAMLLQDTAQAGPETVPFANAAACLQAYRRGLARPRGGMKALAEGLGQRFAAFGGDLRTATRVDSIEKHDDGFVVVTRRRDRLKARQVALNLPLDLAAGLLGRSLAGRLARLERRSRARWSAFTGYLALDRSAVPDDSPLFHHVLRSYDRPIHDGNNVLISLSSPDDPGYGPPDVRVATMSTHTRPDDWIGLDREAYAVRKQEYSTRMLDALGRALPGAPTALVHSEFASPRSFERYTRRVQGAVGGPPVGRRNSNALAVGSDVFGPGVWVVGDSVFPGQGTLAVVLSAIRVVERITGRSWASIRAEFRAGPGVAVEALGAAR